MKTTLDDTKSTSTEQIVMHSIGSINCSCDVRHDLLIHLHHPNLQRHNVRAWRIFPYGDAIENGAIDDGYGYSPWPDPPTDAPPGVTADEYNGLTPGEKILIWQQFWGRGGEGFGVFVARMIQIRHDAIEWAAAQEPVGETDGPQDAMRHAYWMCLMAREFGEPFARDWGYAHEEYSTDPLATFMDLNNNAIGRLVGTNFNGSCGAGVWQARSAGWLQLMKTMRPNRNTPRQPNPSGAWPPLDQ